MKMRGDYEGGSLGKLGDPAMMSMTAAQARSALLGAFDKASKADQCYLIKLAMMLGGAGSTGPTANDMRAGVLRARPAHLRLVRAV